MNNKAPAGYGLGANASTIPGDDLNNAILGGFYVFSSSVQNTPSFKSGKVLVMPYANLQYYTQIAFAALTSEIAFHFCNNGVWVPWEYLNPLLSPGVEYRTTERFNGKPVYAKLVNLGTPTDGKSVSIGSNYLIEAQVIMVFSSYTLPSPELPYGAAANSLPSQYGSGFYTNKNEVILVCGSSLPEATAYARVKYIKEAP